MASAFPKSRTAVLAITAALFSGTVAAPTAVAEEGDHLFWGIRASFNEYVGGHTWVGDGAEPATLNDTIGFNFKLREQTYDKETKRLEAQFDGKVIYKQYCDGQSGNDPEYKLKHWCALDLTMENPRVVIDDDQPSYLEATVKSRQYSTGQFYQPEEPVKIVNLYPQAGTYNQDGNKINWSEIPSTITHEGNLMMSNFYEPDEGMDPVHLTYHGEGENITSNDVLRTHPTYWDSPEDFDKTSRLFDTGDSIITSVAGKGIYLLSADLKEIDFLESDIDRYGAAAYDAKTKTFYYANNKSDKLMAVPVTVAGLGEPKVVTSGHGEILALGAHPKTGAVVAITQDPSEGIKAMADEKPARMISLVNGEARVVELPGSNDLLGVQLGEYSPTAYRFGFDNDQIREMLPMDDGTFVFVPSSNPSDAEEGKEIHDVMVSIKPDATEGADAAKYMPGSRHDQTTYYGQVITNGKRIIRANALPGEDTSYAEMLEYNDRDVEIKVAHKLLEQAPGWGGGTFDTDGTAVYLSGMTGKLTWINPETFEITKTAAVPDGRGVEEHAHGPVIARKDGTIYTPTLNRGRGDYREHYVLRRLINLSTFVPSENAGKGIEELKKLAAVELAKRKVEQAEKKVQEAEAAGDSAAVETAKAALADARKELSTAKCELDPDDCDGSDTGGTMPSSPAPAPAPSMPAPAPSPAPSDPAPAPAPSMPAPAPSSPAPAPSMPAPAPSEKPKDNSSIADKDQNKALAYGFGAAFGAFGILGMIVALALGPLKAFIFNSPFKHLLGL
ncbi:hypothetical protein CPHO_00560 [Corynebacterium phocae]|uniref:Htaa domain-containing protein n=1 Tax=Corynebacterium phocae TaxID=161895 RepID=A0A1L7D0I8_9CORY|nr:HtaA domain-containing protein [Corynebacterium phocae]APT91665.1 hypothetical protein CPHO_00560 [Corynebacterium phocae]KAA8728642.1 hypothetical protein F4V58_00115 [Corynebacterium phocae]